MSDRATEHAISRLQNWKFDSASIAVCDPDAEGFDEEKQKVTLALSHLFGNSGCFDGDMGLLVSYIVKNLTGREAI